MSEIGGQRFVQVGPKLRRYFLAGITGGYPLFISDLVFTNFQVHFNRVQHG
jgi:hypothetical protein